jgi:hypothetical protein
MKEETQAKNNGQKLTYISTLFKTLVSKPKSKKGEKGKMEEGGKRREENGDILTTTKERVHFLPFWHIRISCE